MAKKKPPKTWGLPTSKQTKPAISVSLKAELETKAGRLVEDVLMPRYVKPPPRDARFNYITDVWFKWLGSTMYFGAMYACPEPAAISPSFESLFARMEYIGDRSFVLSYMRHTDKWFRLPVILTGEECLSAVENDWHFQLG